jgi:hypothetical protein
MKYLTTNYDHMLIGDMYHWEQDQEGNLVVMENTPERAKGIMQN